MGISFITKATFLASILASFIILFLKTIEMDGNLYTYFIQAEARQRSVLLVVKTTGETILLVVTTTTSLVVTTTGVETGYLLYTIIVN